MLAEWSLITYWRGLTSGDPVAWGITIVIGGGMVFFLLRSWPRDDEGKPETQDGTAETGAK